MNAWWKIGIILALFWGGYGSGFYTAKKFDRAADADALQANINSRIDTENRLKNLSSSYEKYRASNESYIKHLLENVRQSHVKTPVPNNCVIPADRMQQIRDAISGASTR